MGRPIYSHELGDPDFAWLISNYRDANPTFSLIDLSGLPVTFIKEQPVGTPDLPVTDEESTTKSTQLPNAK